MALRVRLHRAADEKQATPLSRRLFSFWIPGSSREADQPPADTADFAERAAGLDPLPWLAGRAPEPPLPPCAFVVGVEVLCPVARFARPAFGAKSLVMRKDWPALRDACVRLFQRLMSATLTS